MFCQKCGIENSEDATYCVSCGEQLKKVSVNSNEPMVNLEKKNDIFENTNQGELKNTNNVQQVRSPLVWSILVTVFGAFTCCCLNPVSLVVGIIAILFSTKVDDKQRRGDFEGAKRDAKVATILNWVGLGFIVLTIIIVGALFALGAINSQSYPTRL